MRGGGEGEPERAGEREQRRRKQRLGQQQLLRVRDALDRRDKRLKGDPPLAFLPSSSGERKGKMRKRLCQNSRAIFI